MFYVVCLFVCLFVFLVSPKTAKGSSLWASSPIAAWLVCILSISIGAAHAQEATLDSAPPVVAPIMKMETPDESKWIGVYQRSGKTVEIGQYMGIGGGAAIVVGSAIAAVSIFTANASHFGAMDWYGRYIGIPIIGAGAVSYTVGPALIAGGAVRQNKALRMIHPSTPKPKLAYTSWVFWGLGRALFLAPAVGVFTDIPAYILGSMQHTKNRKHWTANTHAHLEQGPPGVAISVAPIEIDGNRGLALVGTF